MQNSYRPLTSFSVFPPVIKNLLIINGLFFLAQMAQGSPIAQLLNHWFALWPIGAPDAVMTPQGYRAVGTFMPWQVVTYSFLHGDLFHLLFNMFGLWMFGVRIENAWGSRRFAIFYFVCVVGAALIQLMVTIGTPIATVGASGGVYGVLMAFGMMFPDDLIYIYLIVPVKAKWFVIALIAISVFSGLSGSQSQVAHFAHLGGMVFGFFLLLYWRGKLPIQPKQRMYY